MYSAEQIRNKAYIPDPAEGPLYSVQIEDLILLADYAGRNLIRVKQDEIQKNVTPTLTSKGYNVEPVEFLGTKFWQISW